MAEPQASVNSPPPPSHFLQTSVALLHTYLLRASCPLVGEQSKGMDSGGGACPCGRGPRTCDVLWCLPRSAEVVFRGNDLWAKCKWWDLGQF